MKLLQLLEAIDPRSIVDTLQFLIERDVVNSSEIKAWAKSAAEQIENPQTKMWFASQLAKYLINQYEGVQILQEIPPNSPDWLVAKIQAGEPVYNVVVSPEVEGQVRSVTEWLNATGLKNNRMSWEQAVEAQSQWHEEQTKAELSAKHMEGLITVKEYNDGFRWIDLQTEACLKDEGEQMGHCVGGEKYIQKVARGEKQIFSLRTPSNSPKVTIEIISDDMGKSVHQIKGKENKGASRKYRKYVRDFLESMPGLHFTYGGTVDFINSGLVIQYQDGENWKLTNIEDTTEDTLATMDDGTSWQKINYEGSSLAKPVKDIPMNALYILTDEKTGRGLGMATVVSGKNSHVTSLQFVPDSKYRYQYQKHVIKLFGSGLKLTFDKSQEPFYDPLGLLSFGIVYNAINDRMGTIAAIKKTSMDVKDFGILYLVEPENGWYIVNEDTGVIETRFALRKMQNGINKAVFDRKMKLPSAGGIPYETAEFADRIERLVAQVTGSSVQYFQYGFGGIVRRHDVTNSKEKDTFASVLQTS